MAAKTIGHRDLRVPYLETVREAEAPYAVDTGQLDRTQ